MIELITGLSVLIVIVPLNDTFLQIMKKDHDINLGLMNLLLIVNMIVVLSYGYLLQPSDNNKLFIVGLLLAILFMMIRKIKIVLKQ